MRQSFQLNLDSPSSAEFTKDSYAAVNASSSTPATSRFPVPLLSVLCYYDFDSQDPDHLPFTRNQILDILKQEETGWWAAMPRGGNTVGWIPEAFVKPLSEEMTERLLRVREELRCYEYDAEQLYNDAPAPVRYDSDEPEPSPPPEYDPNPQNQFRPLPITNLPEVQYTPPVPTSPGIPPSPATPVPIPPKFASDKPTPPTPKDEEAFPIQYISRSSSLAQRNPRGMTEPTLLHSNEETLPVQRSNTFSSFTRLQNHGSGSNVERDTPGHIQKDSIVHNSAPLHTSPSYSSKAVVEGDQIRFGTLDDLILRLTLDTVAKDPSKMPAQSSFQKIFLTTFRTFTTPDTLFKKLVEQYSAPPPPELQGDALEEWKEKIKFPAQCKVLNIFTLWLEDHRLLEEEPHIASWMTQFLTGIHSPKLASMARWIIQTIERLTFASPRDTTNQQPVKPRRSKPHKGDLLRLDPVDLAEQLCLIEHRLYAKITPQEVLIHPQEGKAGTSTPNLTAFCATYDQLASWVKMSVLDAMSIGRRADTVNLWIKVAEKCRNMSNFASMSAIINALSSSDITRLHLTWAHTNRNSHLDALLKFNDPTGGWSGYRTLLGGVDKDACCVPFIGMFLTDMVHIGDQFKDDNINGSICFLQRQRWYEVTSSMLKYQTKPYPVAESSTHSFVQSQLRNAGARDQRWFYARSQEVQQSELANADIRKGLEAAGF